MDSLEERLEAAATRVRGTRGVALVGRDGLLVAAGGPEAGSAALPRVAAEATDLLAAAERTLEAPSVAATGRAVSVHDAVGSLHLYAIDAELFLLWWLAEGADPGVAADASEALAADLGEVMP